jgi:hypothetical protein
MALSTRVPFPRLGDVVEDRTLYNGTGCIAYLKGNEIAVRYTDGSEETVDCELLAHHAERHWTI